MIRRKTIHLDAETDRLINREAKRRKVSRSEVIRDAVRIGLKANGKHGHAKNGHHPFWEDEAVYHGPVPADTIANLDRYLYDAEEGQ